jgi:hypothetical protein
MNEIQHIPSDSWDETLAVAAGTALLRLITVLPTQFSNAVFYQSADTRIDESKNLIRYVGTSRMRLYFTHASLS